MPIYSYTCSSCGKSHDAMKSFKESDDTELCPYCGKETKRVISEPGAIIYNASGFYCKDNPHTEGCNCSKCKGE